MQHWKTMQALYTNVESSLSALNICHTCVYSYVANLVTRMQYYYISRPDL